MPITSGDIAFFPGVKIGDTVDSGGPRRNWPLTDGLSNNLFADITPDDRALGRVSIQKIYPSLVSTNDDALGNCYAYISEQPTDAAVDCVLFAAGDLRPSALSALTALGGGVGLALNGWDKTGLPSDQVLIYANSQTAVQEGDLLTPGVGTFLSNNNLISSFFPHSLLAVEEIISATGGLPSFAAITVRYSVLYASVSGSAFPSTTSPGFISRIAPESQCVGCAQLSAGASAGASTLSVNRVFAKIVPFTGTVYPSAAPPGLGAANVSVFKYYGGKTPIFRAGGLVLVTDGTNSEIVAVQRVGFNNKLFLTGALVNSYSSGAKVCGVIALGDLKAVVPFAPFAQQTWTKSWSDTRIGNPISANYNVGSNPIVLTNESTITERWAIVFTSSTAFRVLGESLGQIATGTTSADCAPLNPVSGDPYFTIDAAGWGSGWANANALRFNTTAAAAPAWVARTVSPSAAGSGTDHVSVALRGTP
jgi:hypothetical protein